MCDLSVCLVHCGKTADRIRMPFGIVGRTGPGMSQVAAFGDRSTVRVTFGSEFGAHHCNQRGLQGVRVLQRRDAALFPNYFWQICCRVGLTSVSAGNLTITTSCVCFAYLPASCGCPILFCTTGECRPCFFLYRCVHCVYTVSVRAVEFASLR